MMDTSIIDSSFKYCELVTKSHYENFPVASILIPGSKRKYIYAVYAFARTADDYADEKQMGTREKRIELLDNWEYNLDNCLDSEVINPIFVALAETIKKFNIPSELFKDLLKAFRQDVEKNRYKTFDELLDYCGYSANPIGRIVLLIFNLNDEKIFKFSDKICTALQLTNFWQDIKIDLENKRIYVPEEHLKLFNVSYEELEKKSFNKKIRDLIEHEVQLTRELFNEGRQIIKALKDKNAGFRFINEIKFTILGGEEILNKIELSGYNTLCARPKLRYMDVIKFIARLNNFE